MNKLDVEMQTRCIYCTREQYAMAVHAISHGEHPCVWCGVTPPVLNTDEYREAYDKVIKGVCPRCDGAIEIRNPTGKCDHLKYPENLDKEVVSE